MDMGKIDLHLHSNCSSDADFDPSVLISMAKEAGVSLLSITDHNNTRAYSLLAPEMTEGITVIPGVELDCTMEGINLHILGYGIDPNDPGFEQIHQDILKQEQKAGIERIRKIQQLGIEVDQKRVCAMATNGVIPGELIAEIALADPRNEDHPLLRPYRSGNARSLNPYVSFYWDYCAAGKPAYVPVHFISLQEAVALIEKTGGIAVLAHPGNNIHEKEDLLRKILQAKVRGVEVYSSYHDAQQMAFYRRKAQEAGCLITCGSDFHGKNKPSIKIGGVAAEKEDEERMIRFFQAFEIR